MLARAVCQGKTPNKSVLIGIWVITIIYSCKINVLTRKDKIMNTKERLYAVIGGCVGAVVTLVVCSFFPLGAQSQLEANFGEITCTALRVVNKENNEIISLGSNPKFGHALVHLKDSNGDVSEGLILAAGDGGTISSFSRRGFYIIDHNEHGARVYLSSGGSGGYVELGIGEHGAEVKVVGELGWETGSAVMQLDANGGKVSVLGKGKNAGKAHMKVDKNGGYVSVIGNGNSKGQAVMGVNEYGSGAVSTWDKNGYRQ